MLLEFVLFDINVFQRRYNDAYAYGALRVGLVYGVKSGLFTALYLYVSFFLYTY